MPAPSLQPLPSLDEFTRAFIDEAVNRRGLAQDSEYVSQCLAYALGILQRGFPVIFDQSHFSALVGYDETYLRGAEWATQKFYRSFSIQKRCGGERRIDEPLPSLREIQRWIYENVLLRVEPSRAAKAFFPGRTLAESARLHIGQGFVLKMDIQDFFPSISRRRVFGLFRTFGYSSTVAGMLSRLCCLNEALPQGAPTSPAISNLILRRADKRILQFCRARGLRYSRYADDFSISGMEFFPGIVRFVRSVVEQEGFQINEAKTSVMRAGGRQSVVGLVVNARVNAPREARRLIRQQAYFIGRFGLDSHLAHKQELRSGAVFHYLGKASFVLSVNRRDRDAVAIRNILRGELNSGNQSDSE